MQRILQTRAWITHCAFNLSRVMYWASGTSIWLSVSTPCTAEASESRSQQEEVEEPTCVPYEFNEELVSELRPSLKLASMVLLVCSVLLDIAIFKWRMLADFILYFNCITSVLTLCFPSVDSQNTDFYLGIIVLIICICFYTDTRGQMFATVVQQIATTFVIKHFIYKEELTVAAITMKVVLLVGIFFVNSVLAMLLRYISQLHARMDLANTENIKLLNGMHEGLLILSQEEPNEGVFCNKSAKKLLQRAVNAQEHCRAEMDKRGINIEHKEPASKNSTSGSLIQIQMFNPVKLPQNNSVRAKIEKQSALDF